MDEQGPLIFVKKNNGPARALAHFEMVWDDDLEREVGVTKCTNNDDDVPCPAEGYLRHLGHKFSPIQNPATVGNGLPVNANADIVGFSGGFGWLLNFNTTAPRSIQFSLIEVDPSSQLLISIPYPPGTTFTITANAAPWCWVNENYSCVELFTAVNSVEAVRGSEGNTYYVDDDGVLTFRIMQFPANFVGNPEWFAFDYDTPGRDDEVYAIPKFQRGDAVVPHHSFNCYLSVQAKCPGDNESSPTDGYCPEAVNTNYDPDICPTGYEQVAYDACCRPDDAVDCVYPDGSAH